MSDPLVVRGLRASYGAARVLGGVDLAVGPGELVALIGGSGSGKTTLLRCVAGLADVAAGTITVGGVTVCADGRSVVPTERRGVGLVFQDYALFPSMDVAANVGFGLARRDPVRVAALLAQVGLSGFEPRRPTTLSGGQQQRVALARALAPAPAVLLLDEPFANVDAHRKGDLARALADEVRDAGAAALLVTHDQEVALAIADRVAVLVGGPEGARIVRAGAPDAVWADPGTLEAARLTGEASVLPGVGRGEVADTVVGPVRTTAPREGPGALLLRPGWARWADGDGPFEVTRCAFRDGRWRLEARAGDVALLIDADAPRGPGTRGQVAVGCALPWLVG